MVSGGAKMPAIGLGTFGSDHVPAERVAAAVYDAIMLGYRHVDCAAVYGNEHAIGESLERVIADGVRRDELWITSKLWNDNHDPSRVAPALERSLRVCASTTSTCTSFTGRSRTPISRAWTSAPDCTPSPIDMSGTWRPGPSSRSSSSVVSSGTSAPRT
jgi:aryl-alcohol dehydrogenase-like predicted oxidoreductase